MPRRGVGVRASPQPTLWLSWIAWCGGDACVIGGQEWRARRNFTVNLYDQKQRLLVEHIDLLRETVRKVKAMHPFEIDAT